MLEEKEVRGAREKMGSATRATRSQVRRGDLHLAHHTVLQKKKREKTQEVQHRLKLSRLGPDSSAHLEVGQVNALRVTPLGHPQVPEPPALGLLLELFHHRDDDLPSTELGSLRDGGVVEVLGREAFVLRRHKERGSIS
jgi:hypothetical protein